MTKIEGLQESAARLERVMEAARSELGRPATDTNWQGLCQNFASTAEETQNLAQELAKSQEQGDAESALLHAFTLRQLEITMNFLSKLSAAMVSMEERLDKMEEEVSTMASESSMVS